MSSTSHRRSEALSGGPRPTYEQIEDGWVRRRPPDHVSSGYKKVVTRGAAFATILSLGGWGVVLLAALADLTFGFGWGLHWSDVWLASGILVLGAAFYFVVHAWFAFIGFYDTRDR